MRRSLVTLLVPAFGLWHGAAISQDFLPTMVVPRLVAAPTVDGLIGEDEWGQAGAVAAFQHFGTLFPADSTTLLYIGYDHRFLYVAFRCATAPNTKPQATVKERDGNTWMDDSVEVFLSPEGSGQYAHLVVNAAGVLHDAWGFDASYDSGMVCRAEVLDDRWECELAIPLGPLRAKPPGEGSKWRGNFCRNAVVPSRGTYTWAQTIGGFHQPHLFGNLLFVGRTPVVRVTRFDPGKESQWVSGTVIGAQGVGAQVKVLKRREAIVAESVTGSATELPCPELPRDAGTYELTYQLTSSSKVALFAQSMFFERQPRLPVRVSKYFFGEKRVYVSLDLREYLRGTVGGSVSFALVSGQHSSAAWEATVKPEKNDRVAAASFSTENLPAGDYHLEVVVRDANGKEADRAELPFRKPPVPPWYANDLGKSNEVPPPWTPVRARGTTATVWDRTYTMGDLALPQSITSGGVELLASPVRLAGDTLSPTRPVRVRPVNDGVCCFEAEAQLSGAAASMTTTVEFDGFTRTDLTLKPRGEAMLQQLALQIPVRREVALLYWHFCLEGYKWERQDLWPNGGFLPEEGWRWRGPFTPVFWLGNRQRGLQWYAESPADWRIADRQRAVEVVTEGDAAVLRLHLIDTPARLEKPLTFTWGLMATPVKPLPPDWRKQRYAYNCGYGSERDVLPKPCHVSFPVEGNLSPARGTLEMEVCPLFDPEFEPGPNAPLPRGYYNQGLLSLRFRSGASVGFYWNIDAKSFRYYESVAGEFPLLFDSNVHLKQGAWHRVGFTWGDRVALRIDGQEVVGAQNRPLPASKLAGATLTVGDGAWIVRNLKVSDSVQPPDATLLPDDSTTLFVPFDRVAKGKAPAQVSLTKGTGIGTVESATRVRVVAGKAGRGLKLDPMAKCESWIEHAAEKGLRYAHIHEHWSDVQSHPDTIYRDEFASLTKGCREADVGLCPYFSGQLSDRSPLWEDHADEFLATPVERFTDVPAWYRPPRQACYGGNFATSPYGDFLIWGIVRLLKEYGIGGIYMDGLEYPVWGDNEHTGLGYTTEDGKRYPSHAIFASREFMKRLYIACRSLKPDFYFRAHASGGPIMPTMSFCSTYFNGEQLGNFPKGYHLPMGRYWAEFYGRNYGFIADVYATSIVGPSEATCFNILHDVLQPAGWLGEDFPALALWELWDEFEMEKARFVPFFADDGAVRCSEESVKVSYYVGPQGVLLAVANMSPERDFTGVLHLDRKRLSLGGGDLHVRRSLNGGASLRGDEVALSLAPLTWRLVWLQHEAEAK